METESIADILIVDDTPSNLEALGSILLTRGHKVRAAPDGKRALAAMKKSAPELVLLDINMPGMDGYDVCAAMREHDTLGRIPVIFLSARSNVEDKVRGFSVGGVDYVTKPFQAEEVIARVEAHLRLRRLERQLTELNADLELRVRARTAELASLNEVYERFVPREFLGLLEKKTIVDVALGDQVHKGMTVMFTDIRDFTSISERMPPQANFDFINAYLGRVSPLIRRNGGFIDKFIGDAVMALYPESADDAVRGVIDIVREVRSFSAELEAVGGPRLRTGTGLHHGELMLGIIGAEHRFSATVIADAVNIASRLDGLAKLYGVDVVVTADLMKRLDNRDAYHHRPLGIIQVKGREQPLTLYEIFDGDESVERDRKLATKTAFEEGLALYYEKRFAEAAVKFDAVSRASPDDKTYKLYLQRAAQYLGSGGAPADWTGAEIMSSK
jgi:class 3 adenylate cyclase/ActR/RegA family two-component response regulator